MLTSSLVALLLASFANARSIGARPPVSPAPSSILKRDTGSDNWCGPVQSGSNFNSIEATWVVPTASLPSGANPNDNYQIYQWIGIDGTSGCNVILQGGTGQNLYNGQISYYTWYEFYPASPQYAKVRVNPGDTVYVKATATSATSGNIYYENQSTGESDTQQLTAPSGSQLCFQSAEWINEDPLPSKFGQFTTFDFTGCKATTSDGNTVTLDGATNWRMYSDSDHSEECHAQTISSTDTRIIYG